MPVHGAERQIAAVERLSGRGLGVDEVRAEVLRLLRSAMTIDAAFFATVDPATLLFTSAQADEPLASSTPLFLDNEFGQRDVNKFAALATSTGIVESLDHATRGERVDSARYRNIMGPLGLGDEVRVALVSAGRCWGVLCLHREEATLGFDADELDLLRRMAPHIAYALRQSIALSTAASPGVSATGPGIVVLGADLSTVSLNHQAERWLSDLAEPDMGSELDLPLAFYGIAARALLAGPHSPPDDGDDGSNGALFARLRRTGGGWMTVHASPLRGVDSGRVALVIDAADPGELSSLLLAAHGLTPAQTRVAALVLRGLSTRQIVAELHISSNTVQEHLHAVFDRFGIGSRRELVTAVMGGAHH